MLLASALLGALLTQAPVVVDGTVGPEEWEGAIEVGPFIQEFPLEAAPPTRATRVRLRFDERTIYVAFECDDDDPKAIVARLTRRDRDSGSDAVSLDIDPRGDAQRAFHFELNAAGVQRDAIRTGDTSLDYDWDAVWRSAVQLTPRGWSAELALPLTALRFDVGHEAGWRFQFRRLVARTNERDAWVLIRRGEQGEMLRYRPLDGLPRFSPPTGVELRPFVAARARLTTTPNLEPTTDYLPSVGMDARLGVTSGISLDATVLPDFGQVEADQAVLNLSTFEIEFPEKRPFFLEGADLFENKDGQGNAPSTQLFYSRRLGAPLQVSAPEGRVVVSTPEVARLWGAAKLTGRIGDSWTVALLDGVTAKEDAILAEVRDAPGRLPLAPMTNFAVARVGRVLPHGFTVNATAADVRRFEAPGSMLVDGTCGSGDEPGADGRCTHDSTTASADATWRSPEGTWVSSAAVFLSARQGGPLHTLRDGTLLRPGTLGFGTRLQVTKPAGTLIADVLYEGYSPVLDLNDAGYLNTQNLHRLFTQLGFRLLDWGPTRETRSTVELFGRETWDSVPIAAGVQLNNYTMWRNFWESFVELQLFPPVYDNRETSDGARTERPAQFGFAWWASTNATRPVVFAFEGFTHTTWRGFGLDTDASLSVRPASQWELSLSPTLLRVTGDPRWVATETTADGHDYRFALQDALAVGATLRASWTLTPVVSLQAYAQLFYATVHYGTVFHEAGPGARPWLTLAGLEALPGDGAEFDERQSVLNGSLVFRWEYLPGSVLFLVYSHAQGGSPEGTTPSGVPRIELESIGRVPSSDVLMLKLSYFFSR